MPACLTLTWIKHEVDADGNIIFRDHAENHPEHQQDRNRSIVIRSSSRPSSMTFSTAASTRRRPSHRERIRNRWVCDVSKGGLARDLGRAMELRGSSEAQVRAFAQGFGDEFIQKVNGKLQELRIRKRCEAHSPIRKKSYQEQEVDAGIPQRRYGRHRTNGPRRDEEEDSSYQEEVSNETGFGISSLPLAVVRSTIKLPFALTKISLNTAKSLITLQLRAAKTCTKTALELGDLLFLQTAQDFTQHVVLPVARSSTSFVLLDMNPAVQLLGRSPLRPIVLPAFAGLSRLLGIVPYYTKRGIVCVQNLGVATATQCRDLVVLSVDSGLYICGVVRRSSTAAFLTTVDIVTPFAVVPYRLCLRYLGPLGKFLLPPGFFGDEASSGTYEDVSGYADESISTTAVLAPVRSGQRASATLLQTTLNISKWGLEKSKNAVEMLVPALDAVPTGTVVTARYCWGGEWELTVSVPGEVGGAYHHAAGHGDGGEQDESATPWGRGAGHYAASSYEPKHSVEEIRGAFQTAFDAEMLTIGIAGLGRSAGRGKK